MTRQISFIRNYAAFGNPVRPFEKADDVGIVATEFLWYEGSPFYPLGALIDAKIASAWLSEGEQPAGDEDNLDVIFKIKDVYGGSFFEIVLRSSAGTYYGGWAWGQSLEITDDIVAGHRVLIAHANGAKDRHEFDPQLGRYGYVETLAGGSSVTSGACRMSKSMRRLSSTPRLSLDEFRLT